MCSFYSPHANTNHLIGPVFMLFPASTLALPAHQLLLCADVQNSSSGIKEKKNYWKLRPLYPRLLKKISITGGQILRQTDTEEEKQTPYIGSEAALRGGGAGGVAT